MKAPLTVKQAEIMRIIRKGGSMHQHLTKGRRTCFRVKDAQHNPVCNIQWRTFNKLKNSERIIQADGMWIANPKKRKAVCNTEKAR